MVKKASLRGPDASLGLTQVRKGARSRQRPSGGRPAPAWCPGQQGGQRHGSRVRVSKGRGGNVKNWGDRGSPKWTQPLIFSREGAGEGRLK